MSNNARRLMPFTLTSTLVILASACASIESADTDPGAVEEAAERQIGAGAVQIGVGDIGNQSSSTSLKQTSVSFPGPFGAAPVVLATPQGVAYQDTFAVTTTAVGTTAFNVNLYRTDARNVGWGQDLRLGWLSLAPTVQPHTQAGTAFAGAQSGTSLKTINVTFSQPFAATPRVLLTPHGQSYGDTFAATTTQVTTTGFTANLWRADASGWGQSLQLDWMAWDTLDDLSIYAPVDGNADIGNQLAATALKSVSVTFPQAFSAPPTVLLTARGGPYSDTFAVTAASVTTAGFTANVDRMDYPNSWGQDLHLDWIALPQTAPCPTGTTLVTDTGACVTLTPWDGKPLPNGARIAMRAGTRFKNDGCNGCTGVESFGPAWVKLTNYQFNSAVPRYDYLDASGAALTSSALSSVTVVPRGSSEFLAGNNPWSYQKLLIQGSDGMYVSADGAGDLASMTDQNDAAILILDLTQGTNAGLYWCGFTYGMNASMMTDNYISVYGASFIAMNGLTFYEFMDGGFSSASFFQLYTVQ